MGAGALMPALGTHDCGDNYAGWFTGNEDQGPGANAQSMDRAYGVPHTAL
jgi:hypothetical protein